MNKTDVLNAILRTRPYDFTRKVFCEVSPHDEYVDNWHMRKIVWELERCRRGETRRLILTLPPRSGKSIAASVAFPAYLLGLDPKLNIISASYSEELSKNFANMSRQVMESDWYRRAFPETRISSRKNTERDIRTTKGGGRIATSIGASLTGFGAHFIIVDDPLNAVDAYSDRARNRTYDWLKSSAMSRLNDKANGILVVVAQRLHADDPVGRLLAEGGWHTISLPAIGTEDRQIQISDDGFIDWPEGEALQPVREPVAILEDLRREMGSAGFEAQYQQDPVPAGGNLIKAEWLNYVGQDDQPDEFDLIVQSWDTASTLSEAASYSVGTTWGVIERKVYLLDVFRARCEYPTLVREVMNLASYWRPDIVLVEKASSGLQLLQALKHDARVHAIAVPVRESKEVRMEVNTPMLESGRVLLPREATWLDVYVRELIGFPASTYSDQVDSTSQALGYISSKLRGRTALKKPREFRRRNIKRRAAISRRAPVSSSGDSGGVSLVLPSEY